MRRINQLIEVHQKREQVFSSNQLFQDKMKNFFDKRTKVQDFQVGDMVLTWNSQFDDKGKHGKFDHLWIGPYRIAAFRGKNAYILETSDGNLTVGGPVNGRFLKPYFQ